MTSNNGSAAWDEMVDESFPASDPPANFTHAGPPARQQPPLAPAAPSQPTGHTVAC